MTDKRCTSPSPMLANRFSNLAACCLARRTSRYLPWRNKAISRAFFSSANTIASSPALGTSDKPKISTGIDGPASLMVLPSSSVMARILPNTEPANSMSPLRKVPDWTNKVATAPRPLSKRASTMMPFAGASTGAFNSNTSASNNTASSKPSMLRPFLAEMSTNWVSPPQESGFTPWMLNSWRIFSGLAASLSILFTATTIGTPAALAWLIASMVCGITPSSAATTNTTMSVALAPRARMAVNASWPGVSKKVTMPRAVFTW